MSCSIFSWEGFQLFSIEYYIFCAFVVNGFDYVKECSFAATWMKLEILILSEVSQEGKDKYHRKENHGVGE